MGFNAEQLDAIDQAVTHLIVRGDPLVPSLREQFPGVMFVRCSARDMSEQPYRNHERYQLHLLDRREHCVQVTLQPENADGVIIAEYGANHG